MKTLLKTGLLCFILFCGGKGELWSQTAGWRWVETAAFTGIEEGYSLAVDTVNDWLYLAGAWDGADLSSVYGPSFGSGGGGLDALVVKYDLNGNVLWAFPIKSPGDDVAFDISVDPFGTVNVVGYFSGATDFKGTSTGSTTLSNASGHDMFLAKYSPNGNLVWAVNNGLTQDTEAYGVASDGSGVYVTGQYRGIFSFSSASSGLPILIPTLSNQGGDLFLVKYNHSGTLQWLVDAGGSGEDLGRKVAVDQSNAYVLGDYDSPTLRFWGASRPASPQDSLSNGGGRDIVLFSANLVIGALSYQEQIYSTGDDHAGGIDVRGALLTHGTLGSPGGNFPGGTVPSNSGGAQANQDVFIARHNKATGFTQWARILNGTSPQDFAHDLDLGTNGLFYICGEFAGNLNMNGIPLNSNGGIDAYVACYAEVSGTPLWVTHAGGASDDRANSVISYRNNSSRVFACGNYENSATFFPLAPKPGPADSNLWVGEIYPCDIEVIYPDTLFCTNDTNPIPSTLTIPGGFYYEPSGNISFVSTVTGEIDLANSTPGGPYQVIYSLLAPCFTSDTLNIYIVQGSDTAYAGPDVLATSLCGQDSLFLAANTPAYGIGIWSVLSGGGGSFSNVNDPQSVFYGQPDSLYQLIWTVSNGPCTPETDTVKIEFPPTVELALAGPDQILCGQDSLQLSAVPVSNSADWGILSGSGGSFNNPNLPNAVLYGIPGQSYTLEWRVLNGICPDSRDTIQISFPQLPSPAQPGLDQQLCGQDSFVLQATAPTVGNATWTLISGSGGSFSSTSQPNATFSATPGQSYQLLWTISNPPCPDSRDTLNLSFPLAPDSANAGPDLTGNALCATLQTQLQGNTPASGSGMWTILSGMGGSLSNPNDPNALFIGAYSTSYTLEWRISQPPCGSLADTLLLQFPSQADTAEAGPDQILCGQTSTTLQGNTLSSGIGTWSIVAGSLGTVNNSSNPQSGFNGLPGETYTLVWSVINASCPSYNDTVRISFPQNPSTALAGPDQSGSALCGASTTSLNANSPAIGNGLWILVSGSGGTFGNPTDSTSTFNGAPGQSYQLAWTINNPPCPVSADTLNISFPNLPPQANAGPDQDTCGTSGILSGNLPSGSTGTWVLNSGAGTLVTPNNASTLVSGLALGTNSFYWILSDGTCSDSSFTVINAFKVVKAQAGEDSTFCQNEGLLNATPPAAGSGSWQVLSGNATLSDPTADTTKVFDLAPGNNAFVWTVENGPCMDSDTVILNLSQVLADAGPDLEVCLGDPLQMQADSSQQGIWSFVSGSGTLSDSTDPRGSVLLPDSGWTVLTWTAQIANCQASDSVRVYAAALPSAAQAGPDQELQDTRQSLLSASPPLIGQGSWSLLSGAGSIRNPGQAQTLVSGLATGANQFVWIVRNGVCPADSDSVILNVLESAVPTGFSPNDDGVNDSFVVRSIKGQSGTQLRVFNRWGDLVYQSDDYQNDWRGIGLKGESLADDTYYIVLRFTDGKEYNGYLVLKR